MYEIILSFITAFCLTYVAIPSIIQIAQSKNLVDEPDERRSHTTSTPSLGGVAIFVGTVFSIIMWTPFNYFGDLQYILCAFIIIFLIGVKDDIQPISPSKKLLGELLAAFILVFKANIKLTSLYGIFGIYALNEYVSVGLTVFTIIVIINAFNLIDGINGLSGSIGILITVVLGTWFYQIQRLEISIVAFALAGSCLAFLRFNITPAKIFMGDTGALLLGLVCSVLAILFIEIHNDLEGSIYYIKSAPSFAVAILILPLFDTLRVFTLRILRGRSPFYADRTHIHHLLLDTGLNHMQATIFLVIVNAAFIAFAFYFQAMGNLTLLILIVGISIVFSFVLSKLAAKNKKSKS